MAVQHQHMLRVKATPAVITVVLTILTHTPVVAVRALRAVLLHYLLPPVTVAMVLYQLLLS